MSKKGMWAIIIILAAILALVAIYSVSETPLSNSRNLTELNVSSEGPFPLSDLIDEIENKSYYEGYDNDLSLIHI